jgi:hypothetical protein
VYVFERYQNLTTRVARFFLEKMYQINLKYMKWSWSIPIVRKIFQMVLKSTFSHPRLSKIYPNLDFWFENKPSGNPEVH